ncbi:uncharacterized protein LOC125738600 [Brienomyrus brachyistius]|uniref:uncharacterized protein LOC125738600 n=1 Tax=Brienomyrus brachyistius TaxID=42636 RepID=UPI0020B30FD7|nr:uncharacterized protein LOC125738600 [Brienomyrus brachyistius]
MDGSKYVVQLNLLAQKNNFKLSFVESSAPESNGMFIGTVVLNNEMYAEGLGHSKKEARQNAAKNALEKLSGENIQPSDSVTSQTENLPPVSNGSFKWANYTCWLNEHGQKERVNVTPKESTRIFPINATQCCRFVVGDREFPEAYGKTRKEAKEEAARLVYEELNRKATMDQEADEPSMRRTCNAMDELSLSTTESTMEANYIGLLNQYCQRNKLVLDFKLLDKKGPPHNPQFFYKAFIGNTEYPEGKGNSAKEAKQNAAQQAWDSLQNQTPSLLKRNPFRLEDSDSPTYGSPVLRVPQDRTDLQSSRESSGGIVFQDSSDVPSPKLDTTPVSNKPKRKLAVTFSQLPSGNKQESGLGAPVQKPPTQSRFSEDYDTISDIGSGGFGCVFKARRKLENRFFAVKRVESKTKSLREVSALTRLRHSNIVQYYTSWEEDVSDTEKYLYIQMELCKSDLKMWIDEHNESQKSRRVNALDIAQQVVNGVEYIHKEGFIHRDLKPENILFDFDGKVKIGDFGLVTFDENSSDGTQLKRTEKKGTRSYMSPEQMESNEYDRKVDIFALGLIYFELVWPMKTRMEKTDLWPGIRNEKKFPKEFSSEYSAEQKLIEKMLAQKPSDRPEASEIASDLKKLSTVLQGKNEEHQKNITFMANNMHGGGNLEERVRSFLKSKGDGAREPALAIAKALGLKTAKDINPTLYDLHKGGQLYRTNGNPPLWSLDGANLHDSVPAQLELKIKDILRSQGGDGWLHIRDIIKMLNQPKPTINSHLYAMKGRGELEQKGKQWRYKDGGDNPGHNWRSLEEFSAIERLGWGGFGSVYKVKHKVDGKLYAVKMTKYKGDREKREVETLANLDHPNIVRYYTSWIGPRYRPDKSSSEGTSESQEGSESVIFESEKASFSIHSDGNKKEEIEEVESGLADICITSSDPPSGNTDKSGQRNNTACNMFLYIKMELCTGGSLNDWFRKGGAERTKEEAMKVFQQIVQGVEYIHSRNLIHRDLKPDNILFSQDNIVKIGDFGLATMTCDQSGKPIERTKGRGTKTYMSPEQEKQSEYDEKTDIFPLGLIFFELLWKMKTGAERAKLWDDLREGKFPDAFTEKFIYESSDIERMLSVSPESRPPASEIKMFLDRPQQTQGLQKAKNKTA